MKASAERRAKATRPAKKPPKVAKKPPKVAKKPKPVQRRAEPQRPPRKTPVAAPSPRSPESPTRATASAEAEPEYAASPSLSFPAATWLLGAIVAAGILLLAAAAVPGRVYAGSGLARLAHRREDAAFLGLALVLSIAVVLVLSQLG